MFCHLLNDPNVFIHLIVLCTINCYDTGIFVLPKRIPNEDNVMYNMRCDDVVQKIEDNFAGYSDTDTIFNIWIKILSTINPFYLTNLKKFCYEHKLNFRCFKNAIILMKQCMNIINNSKNEFNGEFRYSNGFTDRNSNGFTGAFAIYHNVGQFNKPNMKIVSKTFYKLLELTHWDCKINIDSNMMAYCGDVVYRIDHNSIHKMDLGNNFKKIYYAMVRTKKNTKNGQIDMVNIIHACPDDDDDFGIFSAESNELLLEKNWKDFLIKLESDLMREYLKEMEWDGNFEQENFEQENFEQENFEQENFEHDNVEHENYENFSFIPPEEYFLYQD